MKKLILTIAIAACTLAANAQTYNRQQAKATTSTSSTGFDKTKLTFGGGLGLQFGNYTVVNIAPQVGYNFSKMFNAGAGVSYSYYSDTYNSGNSRFKDTRSYFGFNVYGKFYPIENIVLMVQPEANRMWRTTKNKLTGDKYSQNKFVPSVLVGGGLRLGPISAMIQYDVAQDKNSPYGDNIFYSVGYTFSF